MPARIEVNVEEREDALAVLQRLDPYHPAVVHSAPKQWQVHAEAPGRQGESTSRALATIEEALAERHLDDAAVRVNGQLYNAPERSRRRAATEANPRPRNARATNIRRPSPRSISELMRTRERNNRPLPHGPIDVSPGELDSLAGRSRGYDDVSQGDVADFVQFVESAGGVKAIATFTHVIGKSEGTISVEREYEDGGKVRIGTRELAFRKNRLVFDPANPDGPDLGFLTAVRQGHALNVPGRWSHSMNAAQAAPSRRRVPRRTYFRRCVPRSGA